MCLFQSDDVEYGNHVAHKIYDWTVDSVSIFSLYVWLRAVSRRVMGCALKVIKIPRMQQSLISIFTELSWSFAYQKVLQEKKRKVFWRSGKQNRIGSKEQDSWMEETRMEPRRTTSEPNRTNRGFYPKIIHQFGTE